MLSSQMLWPRSWSNCVAFTNHLDFVDVQLQRDVGSLLVAGALLARHQEDWRWPERCAGEESFLRPPKPISNKPTPSVSIRVRCCITASVQFHEARERRR